MKSIIKNRRNIQYIFSMAVIGLIAYRPNGLLIVLGISVVLGIVLGKVFCKWMCPMGLLKEVMTKNMSEEEAKSHMFNYYKVGCPISWIQGVMNKFSLFQIRVDKKTCLTCGLCDKACYIPTFDDSKSVFKTTKEKAPQAFNCSKCFACVDSCPNGSLKYSVK